MEISVYNWSQIQKEQLNPQLARVVIHGEKMTVARFYMKKGGVVAEHSHANEEISLLEEGKVAFFIRGQEQLAVAGQVIQIPPSAPHVLVALEDSVALELFAPVREDWIRGDDAYLRK